MQLQLPFVYCCAFISAWALHLWARLEVRKLPRLKSEAWHVFEAYASLYEAYLKAYALDQEFV